MPTVLIADDDATYRRLLRYVLEDEGYTVLEAETGAATLTILQQTADPLVVILDIFMPLNGGIVLDGLVNDPALAQRHRVIVVSLALSRQIPASVQALNLPVVPKPFDVDDLLRAIATP
jgi:two-component system, response regulator, stage 0 sporulation protein F